MPPFNKKPVPEIVDRMMKSIDTWMLAGDLTSHIQHALDNEGIRARAKETQWGRISAQANALWQARCDGSRFKFKGQVYEVEPYQKALYVTKSASREVKRPLDWKLFLERKPLSFLLPNEVSPELKSLIGIREFKENLPTKPEGTGNHHSRTTFVVRTKKKHLLPAEQRIKFLPLFRRATPEDKNPMLTRLYKDHVHLSYEDDISWIEPTISAAV